jgi:hypothetical protein
MCSEITKSVLKNGRFHSFTSIGLLKSVAKITVVRRKIVYTIRILNYSFPLNFNNLNAAYPKNIKFCKVKENSIKISLKQPGVPTDNFGVLTLNTLIMKSIKFLIAAWFTGFALNAQTVDESSNTDSMAASFGVKGGVNFANVTGNDFESPDSRTSFHVGVVGELPISEMFSLQAEAMYSGQGFETNIPGEDDQNIEYQLDYINVPVLAKIYLTDGLSIEAGPQFGFKVNEEIDSDPNNNPGDIEVDEAESFDFGLAGGLTFQTQMGLFASGRYTYGVSEIISDADVHNSVFQISLGYKF